MTGWCTVEEKPDSLGGRMGWDWGMGLNFGVWRCLREGEWGEKREGAGFDVL